MTEKCCTDRIPTGFETDPLCLPSVSKDTLPSLSSYLLQLFASQIPFLNAAVSASGKQRIALYCQSLQAVLMGRIKIVCGTDAPLSTFHHIKNLQRKRNDLETHHKV